MIRTRRRLPWIRASTIDPMVRSWGILAGCSALGLRLATGSDDMNTSG